MHGYPCFIFCYLLAVKLNLAQSAAIPTFNFEDDFANLLSNEDEKSKLLRIQTNHQLDSKINFSPDLTRMMSNQENTAQLSAADVDTFPDKIVDVLDQTIFSNIEDEVLDLGDNEAGIDLFEEEPDVDSYVDKESSEIETSDEIFTDKKIFMDTIKAILDKRVDEMYDLPDSSLDEEINQNQEYQKAHENEQAQNIELNSSNEDQLVNDLRNVIDKKRYDAKNIIKSLLESRRNLKLAAITNQNNLKEMEQEAVQVAKETIKSLELYENESKIIPEIPIIINQENNLKITQEYTNTLTNAVSDYMISLEKGVSMIDSIFSSQPEDIYLNVDDLLKEFEKTTQKEFNLYARFRRDTRPDIWNDEEDEI